MLNYQRVSAVNVMTLQMCLSLRCFPSHESTFSRHVLRQKVYKTMCKYVIICNSPDKKQFKIHAEKLEGGKY